MSSLSFRILVLLIAAFFSNGSSAAQGLAPQTSSQSAVTVKVTPRNLQGALWEFEVVFDTHSQELKDDLSKNVVLIAADGTPVPPADWQGDAPGGHHRKGVLRFNALIPPPSTLEMRINRDGEPKSRSFRWELN